MIDHIFKIRVVNVQKVIEVPGSRIESLDNISLIIMVTRIHEKVQVGKDQEKAQSEKDSRWEKTKLTIRYFYHETYRKPNEQLFSQ